MSNGDFALAKATEHFKSQLQDKAESVEVPEWGVTVHFRPMNGKQRDAISKHITEGNITEACVESILVRARDEDGKLMFKPVHRRELMTRVDPDVVLTIATAMHTFDTLMEDEEEIPTKKS